MGFRSSAKEQKDLLLFLLAFIGAAAWTVVALHFVSSNTKLDAQACIFFVSEIENISNDSHSVRLERHSLFW